MTPNNIIEHNPHANTSKHTTSSTQFLTSSNDSSIGDWSTVSRKHHRVKKLRDQPVPIAVTNKFTPLNHLNLSNHKNPLCPNVATDSITIGLWNAQSLRQKTELVKDIRDEFDLDLFLLVETWLKTDNVVEIGELECNGECHLIHEPREGRQGGGIGCLARSGLNVRKKDSVKTNTFEHMEIELQNNRKCFTILVVYRPEPTQQNKYCLSDFYEEFIQFLTHYHTYHNEVIITGDFNFHVNKPNDQKAQNFLKILDMFDLTQHISSPTHKHGNTLDLVITRKNSALNDCFIGDLHSDHNCIILKIKATKDCNPEKMVTIRDTRNIDIRLFKKDLMEHFQLKPEIGARSSHLEQSRRLEKLVNLYNSTRLILDKHAPSKRKRIVLRNPTPWTTKDIKDLKTAKRKAEKQWRKTNHEKDWETFKEKKNAMNARLKQMKSDDLKAKIRNTKGDSKSMFKILNASLNRKQTPPLPHHSNDKQLANEFNTYFQEKICKIRSKLNSRVTSVESGKACIKGGKLQEFQSLSQAEVKKLMLEMPKKHCQLDPLPTWLLRECLEEFLPITTEIVNLSLQLGEMPSNLKHALVKPLLKKAGLEPIKKNYRPVSNLPFLSKIIEGAVINQYTEHISKNKLDDKKQSAYKKFHSTETLLMKIHDDVMQSMGKGEVSILVLLDLSAAFDTIDHTILIQRLKDRYNIHGRALEWFKSYLSQRSQAITVNDTISDKTYMKYGVPQGSKLGPILFNSYIAPVSEVARRHKVKDEKYADDEQLLLSFKPNLINEQLDAINRMENCINDIRDFLHQNMLCNNGEKTEFLIVGTSHQLKKLKINSIKVDNTEIRAVDDVRNLGVIFDKEMTMEKHVNKMCRSAYFNLRNVSKIRQSLDRETVKTAVNALVTPHLDYGNGLLYGISERLLDKLQVAQNSAVRLIEQLKRRDHITCYRKNLHWLPIRARIKFKILTNTWKALNYQSPEYIKSLLQLKKPLKSLRSNNKMMLRIPKTDGNNNMADRAFSHVAPQLWNPISYTIKSCNSLESFKRKLKTHLFQSYYD